MGWEADITPQEAVEKLKVRIIEQFGRLDILANNAANNPSISNKKFMGRAQTII